MKKLLAFMALLLALIAVPAAAQPSFPELAGQPVVDAADVLDPAQEAALNQQLLDFETRNQRQFVIVTIPSLDGYDIADYGYQLGREWGIGDAERNDGVLLIVAPNDKKMRIETGYGLEGTLPDGLAFEYIEAMKPFFRNGDFPGGIQQGANLIITQLELPPEEAARIAAEASQQRSNDGGVPIGGLIWLGFLLFFFILPALFGRGRSRRYRHSGVGGVVGDIILWEAGKAIARGASGGSGWSGGGGFGGGGGFSGGGGSFGGGGASGGW